MIITDEAKAWLRAVLARYPDRVVRLRHQGFG